METKLCQTCGHWKKDTHMKTSTYGECTGLNDGLDVDINVVGNATLAPIETDQEFCCAHWKEREKPNDQKD